MQNQIPPIVLTFGASDPLSATGIQADLASFAAMGCHGVSAVTAILVGDTSSTDDIHALESEIIDDQARTLLEDMQVAAFKIGLAGSVENVSVIAEIISDYPDTPVVLDAFNTLRLNQSPDPEDMVLAILELLIPQTTLLLISATDLSTVAESWRDDAEDTENESVVAAQLKVAEPEQTVHDEIVVDVMTLIEAGCEYVFVTGVPSDNKEIANALFNESGVIRNDRWQRIDGQYLGAGNTLSAAITALLAKGLEIPEAVLEAQEFTVAAIQHAQRFGMGKMVPDRYFWSRDGGEPVAQA